MGLMLFKGKESVYHVQRYLRAHQPEIQYVAAVGNADLLS